MNLNQSVTWGTRRPLLITQGDALAAVIGFCFGRNASGRRLFAYASYDAALRGAPDPIEGAIHAANGLNANLSASDLLELLHLHEQSSLPDLSQCPPFWTLPYADVLSDPSNNTPAGMLWKWYHAVTAISGLGGAASSKTGHHLAPTVMPLWDSLVGRSWHLNHMWAEFHQQLNQHVVWCADLERGVEHYRVSHEGGFGIPVSRLRIVDIVLWLDNRGELALALSTGQELLAGLNPSAW